MEKQEHGIILQNKKMQISGVKEMISATEKAIIIKLAENNLQICGQNLKIEKLSPEENSVVISGDFQKIEYGQSKKGFFKRLFK